MARGRAEPDIDQLLAEQVAYYRSAGIEHDVFNGGEQELIFVEIELLR